MTMKSEVIGVNLGESPTGDQSVQESKPEVTCKVKLDVVGGNIGINGDNAEDEDANTLDTSRKCGVLSNPDACDAEDKENCQHVVQNQMTPTYATYPQATGLEEYQVMAGQPTAPGNAAAAAGLTTIQNVGGVNVAVSAIATEPSGQTMYTTTTPITANGTAEQQTTTEIASPETSELGAVPPTGGAVSPNTGPKRLHVSNIPFRFREADLRQLLGQFGTILDVEIIFNERGSKGFGFVTFANSSDADRAREKLNGTVVEGRKIEVNNATARIMTKKVTAPTIPADSATAAALRGVALTRGRAAAAVAARGLGGVYTAAAAAAAAAGLRHPTPLAAAAPTAIPYAAAASLYQDPFIAAYDPTARYQVGQLVTTQPYATAASYPARYAIPAAAVATPVTYTAAAAGYGRDYAAETYIGHGIGPVAGYGAAVYRGGYSRFAPY